MQTFDQALGQLVSSGALDFQQALGAASNPHDLKVMLERMGAVPAGGTFVTSYNQ
jgi:Tfp pilus assembly ATPase PilU